MIFYPDSTFLSGPIPPLIVPRYNRSDTLFPSREVQS